MSTIPEIDENDCLNSSGQFLRKMDNGWGEYIDKSGRRFYYNADEDRTSWKPPRKSVNKGETTPTTITKSTILKNDENVGSILKKGTLTVAKLWYKNQTMPKKWKKSMCVLTDSHFVFKHNKGTEGVRISLATATVKRELHLTKRRNAFRLCGKEANILFHSEKPLEVETWYHAIEFVIGGFSKGSSIRSFYSADDLNLPLNRTSCFKYETRTNRYSLHTIHEVTDYMETPKVQKVLRSPEDMETPRKILSSEVQKVLRSPEVHSPSHIRYPTPPGWISRFEVSEKRYVYEHTSTGQVWGAAARRNGGVYFFDISSGRSAFFLPEDLSPRKETEI